MNTKLCNKCNKTKDKKEFYKRSNSKCGVDSYCKNCRRLLLKTYKNENQDKIKTRRKLYYEKNKEVLRKEAIEYAKRNKEDRQLYNKRYRKRRKKEDPLFKLNCTLKARVYKAFKAKSWRKEGSQKLLGCTWEEFHKHIESTFQKGMTWENHGHGEDKWHIDHIIPLSSAKNEEELKLLCHYTNLQALWQKDNLSKSNKLKWKKKK